MKLSKTLGFAAAAVVSRAARLGLFADLRRARPGPVNRTFRRLQVLSAAFVALTHGTNDAQKTMGVIALALLAAVVRP